MKKMIFLLFLLCITCGCVNLANTSYDYIVKENLNNNLKTTNVYRAGYMYYLPKGLRIMKSREANEVFANDNITYYLFVDRVSYYNQIKESYVGKDDVVYSKSLEKDGKFGYIEIKKTQNNQYFIEIMYNYAKIEVMVPEDKVKETISYSLTILTSIKYQDTVLKSLMEENILSASEVEYNIFETANTESGYLQIAQEYGQYQEEEENVDPDFIRR